MTAHVNNDSLGPFGLGELMNLTKPQREWLLVTYLTSVGAPDLAAKVNGPLHADVTFNDLIAAGTLRQFQAVRSMRDGVPDAVVKGNTVWVGTTKFKSPSTLADYLGHYRKRGRPSKYPPGLDRVNDDGSLTPLDELMSGPAYDHAVRRAEKERIRLFLQAVGKPFHRCTKCGTAEREVRRLPLEPSQSWVHLSCGHMRWVEATTDAA